MNFFECQWKKKHAPKSWQKLGLDCEKCQDRFECHTKQARRFVVEATIEGLYEVFAESDDDIRKWYECETLFDHISQKLKKDVIVDYEWEEKQKGRAL